MRQPKPWYRTSKAAWYVQLGDRQIQLAKGPKAETEKVAWDAFYKLMAQDPAKLPKPAVITVAVVCDLFLQFAETHNDARTFRWYEGYLQDFCNSFGRLKVEELKPFHITRWLDAHPGWKAARRHAVTAVKRAFNWAEKEGVIPASPVKSVSKPPVNKRPAVLTKAQRLEVLAAIPDEEFRLFVEAMQESGARPSEVARVTARDVDLKLGIWVLDKHKTRRKTGKPRVIYLTPRLLAITKQLMSKHPEGALFRGPRLKKPFGMHGICSRFRRLKEKLPHLRHAVAYAIRHGYATDALMNGVGVAQVAELLGHKDTAMVTAHYSHLAEQSAYMKEVARKAVS